MAVKNQPLSTTGFKNVFLTKVLKDSLSRARSRVVMDKASFYAQDFANKLTSWTVSGDLTNRSILAIQKAANTAIENGTDFASFKRMITPQVLNNIVVPEVVYRNAINFAYQTGRFNQQDFVKAIRPFLQYVTFGDEKVRPNHALMNGTVAAFDDPFWGKNYPPNGHNCRCVARSVTERQVKRLGLDVTTDKEVTAKAIADQVAKGIPRDQVVLPRADPGWIGSFKSISNGAENQIKAFGTLPKTFFSFITPDPVVVAAAPAAEVVQSQTIISAALEPDYKDFTKTGPQLGTNPGEQAVDKLGQKFYIKFVDEDHAHNEVLANKLYGLAGIENRPAVDFVRKDGKRTVLSKWTDDLSPNKTLLTTSKVDGVADGFAADAWLSNWDVVGKDYDNLKIAVIDGKKTAFRVDQGGSLKFRAMGEPKGAAFGDDVAELKNYLNEAVNKEAYDVFKNYSTADFLPGAERVGKIKSADIRKMVNAFSRGTAQEKKALADKLIARRDNVKAWAAEQKAAGNLEQKAAKAAQKAAKAEAVAQSKAAKAAAKADKEAAIAAQKETAAQDKARKGALKKADKAAQEEAATTSNKVFERLKTESEEARDFERGAQRITKKDVAKIEQANNSGYSIPGDGTAVEDQQVMFYKVFKPDGTSALNASAKLRGEDLDRIKGALKLPNLAKPVDTLNIDTQLDFLEMSLSKSYIKQAPLTEAPYTIFQQAYNEFQEIRREVDRLVGNGSLTVAQGNKITGHYYNNIAKYRKILFETDGSRQVGKVPFISKDHVPFARLETIEPSQKAAANAKLPMNFHLKDFVVKTSDIKDGNLFETGEVGRRLDGTVWKHGKVWEADYKGATIRIGADEKNYAMNGKITVQVKGDAEKASKKAMEIFEELGVDMTPPKFADAEELHLIQIAAKIDPSAFLPTKTGEYMRKIMSKTGEFADQDRRISALKDHINLTAKTRGRVTITAEGEDLGAFRIDREPDYNPIGRREGPNGTGRLIRETPKNLEGIDDFFRDENNLVHQAVGTITRDDGSQVRKEDIWDEIIDNLLTSNGDYHSTIDRFERGLYKKGWSPEEDIDSGGAGYAFTRILNNRVVEASKLPSIIMDADRIRRVDAVSYVDDVFGKVNEGTLINRASSSTVYENYAKFNTTNEVNFKGSFNVLEGIKYVTAKDFEQWGKIVEVFKKHGLARLPDGRRVEEVVQVVKNLPKLKKVEDIIKVKK